MAAVCLVMSAALVSSVSAQGIPTVPGSERIHEQASLSARFPGGTDQSNPLGENIDLFSGSLGFTHVDLELKGNGPDINITRSWSITRNSYYYNFAGHNGAIQDWEMEIPSIETSLLNSTYSGSLWRAPGAQPGRRCSNFGYPLAGDAKFWWTGAHLIVPGQSQQVLLQRDPSYTLAPGGQPSSYPIVTNRNWAISCTSQTKNNDGGEGFVAISPAGEKYWFDWYTQEKFGNVTSYYTQPMLLQTGSAPWDMPVAGVVTVRMRPTRIEDRHGNYVTYLYTGNLLTRIEGSDGRFVNLFYEIIGAGGVNPYQRLTSIEYDNGSGGISRVVYEYQESTLEYPVRIHRSLKKVIYPDGSSWGFDLSSVNGICRHKSPLPSGAYDFQCRASGIYDGLAGPQAIVTTPSGLQGKYQIGYGHVERWAENCPRYGFSGTDCYLYPVEPTVSPAFRLKWKEYTGAGIKPSTWTYQYLRSEVTPLTVISNPDGSKDAYKYGAYNKYSQDDGVLLAHYEGAIVENGSVSSATRTVLNSYVRGIKVGTAPQYFVNRLQSEYLVAPSRISTQQDGVEFVTNVTNWDGLLRPARVERSSAFGGKVEQAEYFDDTQQWVLGQAKRRLINGMEFERVEFDANSLPWRSFQFGKILQTVTYDTTSAPETGQRGTVKTVTDGEGNTTTYGQWKRQVPQLIQFADGTSQSTNVKDNGWIEWSQNESGARTCYTYDAMGRLASTTYTSETAANTCDGSKWTATTYTWEYRNVAEHGLPAGHWLRRNHTGNHRRNTFYDVLWRPVLEHYYDGADTNATIQTRGWAYDVEGLVMFASYPVNALVAGTTGIWTAYDALGRTTSVSQDSELGLLTTLTEYLPGFKTRVTNPRGQQTLTSYQVYDTPTYDFPVRIEQPEGVTTVIIRDVFGKPTQISR